MFVPTDKRRGHAIREAVYAVMLSRPPSAGALENFVSFGKRSLADELPSYQPFQMAGPISLGMNEPLSLSFGAGGSFQIFRPDGSLSWRLMAVQNQIIVNCLEYDEWETVWPRAKRYISLAYEAMGEPDNLITNGHLQYINAFHWEGSTEPDFTALLNPESDHIPRSFWAERSLEWHLHQGWFATDAKSKLGRRLSRQHLTSHIEEKGPTVLVDLMDRYDFNDPVSGDVFFGEICEEVFSNMRRDIRAALRNYLLVDVAKAIGAVELP